MSLIVTVFKDHTCDGKLPIGKDESSLEKFTRISLYSLIIDIKVLSVYLRFKNFQRPPFLRVGQNVLISLKKNKFTEVPS